MAARRSSSHSLALKAGELAFAAPQVIAHRLTRMAQSGSSPTAADRREWMRMSSEKLAAFNESWFAIGLETWRIQQRQMLALMTSFATPWTATYTSAKAQRDATALWGRALAPVHRRAVANAKRLGSKSGRR